VSVRRDSGGIIQAVTVSAPLATAPLWMGTMERGRLPARLEPADLRKHVAVFGAAGAGKTYFAKTLVEEAVLAGIPALVFDVQGDLAQLAQPQPNVPPELAERRDRYASDVEVRLYTPGSDAGLRVSLNPVRLPDASFNEDERAFCLANMADNLLGTVDIPPSWRKRARGYITQHLEAAVSEGALLSLEDLIGRLRAPETLAAEPLLAKRNQREALVEQLRLLTVGTDRLLFQRGRPLDIGELTRPTLAGKTPLNILWLNGLGDQAAKERFVAMVLSDLYVWGLRHPSPNPQLLFYLDEVGPFMPPHGEPPSKAILKRLFKEGRKLGLCGLFCTQNFADVDYKVFGQASTLAIGRVYANQDRDKARKILDTASFDADTAVTRLGGAPSGRFLVRNPDRFPAPTWIQGRPLLTVHGSPWTEQDIRAHTPAALREGWNRG
jgi:Helicase HerA, central domain